MLTRVRAVPYANAFRPGAPYKGEEVLRDLETILREFRPTKVFLSHPGDHMPDHRALYLFTRIALWDVAPEIAPEIYPYLVHFKRWPYPRGFRPAELLEPPTLFKDQIDWRSHPLTQGEIERKQTAIKAHRTQYNSSAKYLISFVRPNELFGDFPVVQLGGTPTELLLLENRDEAMELPEQLSDEERAAFVGFEEKSVHLEDHELVLSIRFSRPLAAAVNVSVFAFGYRTDRPFAQMPKLRIDFGELRHEVYDQDQPLPHQDAIQVTHEPRQLTIRIPLELLGEPQRILTSARSYLSEVPLDWISWRVLELPADY
jgi:hypothetical protein